MTTRREFLTYTGAGAGALVMSRSMLGCTPGDPWPFSGNVTIPEGFTVPAGELAVFDPNVSTTVTVSGNVVVKGTLRMRPANPGVVHTLKFTNVNESGFVGGHTTTPLASDVGLWVTEGGILDAVGSPKAGWNRTGTHTTWAGGDELLVAPLTMAGGFTAYTGTVPSVVGPNGVTYKTEVFNLTRNVRIEGTPGGRTHVIFLQTTQPQTLRFVQFRHMAPMKLTGVKSNGLKYWQTVTGRYGCHFHMDGDASRGSLVEGCVVRDSGGAAFVAHMSNGVTFRDCITYQTTDKAYWWDALTSSDAITYDHCGAFWVKGLPGDGVPEGHDLDVTAFHLNRGTNISALSCVVVKALGAQHTSGGFHWPEKENLGDEWIFEDCVAHACRSGGISGWQNDTPPYVHNNMLDRFVSYGNGIGLSNGAYVNNYTFRDGICFDNTFSTSAQVAADLVHSTSGGRFERCWFETLTLGHHRPRTEATQFVNCTIGHITVNEPADGIVVDFRSTQPQYDLTPSDFTVIRRRSVITVYNSNGSSFTVT